MGLLPAGSPDTSTQRHADGSRMGATGYTRPLPGSHQPPRLCKAAAYMCAPLCTSPGPGAGRTQAGGAWEGIAAHPSTPLKPSGTSERAWACLESPLSRQTQLCSQDETADSPRGGEGPRRRHTLWLARAGPREPGHVLSGPWFHGTEATLPMPGGWRDEHLLANGDPPHHSLPRTDPLRCQSCPLPRPRPPILSPLLYNTSSS